MNIHNAPFKRAEKIAFEHAHETSQHNQIHPRCLKRGDEGAFGDLVQLGTKRSGRNKLRRQLALPRVRQNPRIRNITEHHRDFRRDGAGSHGIGDCDKIGTFAGTEHAQAKFIFSSHQPILAGDGEGTKIFLMTPSPLPSKIPRRKRMTVTLFIPCFVDALYPRAGISMVEILERLGHRVVCPEAIACCGQPPFNSGYQAEARAIAAPVLDQLADAEAVVIGSGSCGAMVKKFYPELFAGTQQETLARQVAGRTWEFSDFLVNQLRVTDLGATFPHKVTFHDGCHGLRELAIQAQPRALLAKVRGLELVEMPEITCCGFGGTFAAKFPMISTAMGEVKCAAAAETGAEYIVSSDSSCLMHIQGLLSRQGKPTKTISLAEVLNQQ